MLRKVFAISLAAIAVSAQVSAHHSLVRFDGNRTVQIAGKVKEFRWVNPHATIELEGNLIGDNTVRQWSVEMASPNILVEAGWSRDILSIGDQITLSVNPARDEGTTDAISRVLYVGVVLASGKTLGSTAAQAGGR